MDRAAPLNFTAICRIQGPIGETHLRGALAAAQLRHPFLRARISETEDESEAHFVFDVDKRLPLRVVQAKDSGLSTTWIDEVEREINTPLPWHEGPLARCVLIYEEDGSTTFLVTLHHSVGDGMSGIYLTRDILRATQRVLKAGSTQLAVLRDTVPIDSRLPKTARGLRYAWRATRMAMRELWIRLRYGKPMRVRRDAHHHSFERRARIIPRVLENHFATKLAERCRAEGTTVHGALSAAMILGIIHDAHLSKRYASIQFGSPINMRERLEPVVSEDIGFYVSLVGYRAGVPLHADFWTLARDVKAKLSRDLERGEDGTTLRLLRVLFNRLGGKKLAPIQFSAKWEEKVPTTSGLTNLGRLPIEARFDPLLLRSMHFAVCPSSLGDFLATATSLEGTLFWNFIWAEPVFTRTHAEELVEDILTRLRAAVDR